MSKTVRTALVCAALAALIVPGLNAQDVKKAGTQEDPKQVVWVMTYSGGGG